MDKKRISVFSCRACQQKIKFQLKPCLIECSSCSQVYKVIQQDGKYSVKTVKPRSSSKQKPLPNEDSSNKRRTPLTKSGGKPVRKRNNGFVSSKNSVNRVKKAKSKFSAIGFGALIGVLVILIGVFSLNWQPVQELKAALGVVDSHIEEPENSFDPKANALDVNVNFDQVKTIFEENCVSCHGEKRQKGKFRMDTLAAVLKGGSSGPALIKGNAEESLLYELVSLHADDEDRMPSDDAPLTETQQITIKKWIESGAPWEGNLIAREKNNNTTTDLVTSPFRSSDADLLKSKDQIRASQHIDYLIDKYLTAKNIKAGAIISDQKFLRRAYLDIIGRIPTLEEYENFFNSKASDKREVLVDELLDSPGFVSSSHNYWLDALRVTHTVGKNSLVAYKHWILQAIKKNMPFDQFAYELIAAEGRVDDPENGSAGYYLRDDNLGFMAEDSLSNTMQLFLATDMLCAQCHDHPYKKWTQKDFYKLLAFTNGTIVRGTAVNRKETNYMVNILKPPTTPIKNGYKGYYKAIYRGTFKGGTGRVQLPSDYKYDDGKPNQLIKAQVPFGDLVSIDYDNPVENTKYDFIDHVRKDAGEDVRSRMHLAKWIANPDNPMFTKTIVNRLWGRVFGSPLVGKNLDMKESDMGDNPNLTHFLIEVMKRAKYDQKVFIKILCKTKAYQRTAVDFNPEKYYHPAPVVKRLTAEQVWDSLLAIRQKDPDRGVIQGDHVTENVVFHEMERLSQPDRVEFIRTSKASKAAASKQYDMVPRITLSSKSHRASMLRHDKTAGSFLDIYGNSGRGLIDGSIQEATIPQALHLMNDGLYVKMSHNRKITSYLHDRLQASAKKSIEVKMKHIYNAILTRDPTDSEVALIEKHFETDKKFNADDLAWALINSHEFKIKN